MRLRASPAAFVGYVTARDEKAALETAVKQFKIRRAEQGRLIALRRN